ncbi:hypothetical protein like AT2G22155 [Hibiscus trionum]|uniref:Prolamin-like domain-containing protein n=1 Tax=Hibiscus trionum TaxID=183268 RepID=A0A9W7M6C5_HIBTR|nr:hypothetical protein like AT2G22155 [Hibiscus trionum]
MEPTTTSKVLMFWLAATCIAAAASAVVPSGSAEETQDLAGCLMSFVSVEGCVEAIHEAVTHKVYDGLKHECCTAITQLGDNCWPILFPDQPYVPLILKAVCKLIGGGAKVEEVAMSPY